ncbi:MAG: KilA-N domain-containing protein [Candidatus Absconditabacterales bacterium]
MKKNQQIQVLGVVVKIKKMENNDFISLTDIAKRKNTLAPKSVVANWLRLRNTVDYLGLWEFINNPNFNSIEFDAFKNDAGTNAFTLSPQQWIEKTQAIGLISKSGKYGGGTFAHKDIALKFASWVSIEFELYLIKEFQRLKAQETHALDRNVKRFLTKMNYKIHTDAIKQHLIPKELSQNAVNILYADEADVLNLALFGMTARQWQSKNDGKQGNMRDYATIEQLIPNRFRNLELFHYVQNSSF